MTKVEERQTFICTSFVFVVHCHLYPPGMVFEKDEVEISVEVLSRKSMELN